jgi:hypothetical protein
MYRPQKQFENRKITIHERQEASMTHRTFSQKMKKRWLKNYNQEIYDVLNSPITVGSEQTEKRAPLHCQLYARKQETA